MMQCYMRQHFADGYWPHEHPGGHASWRETYDEGERNCVQIEHSEDAMRIGWMRAENNVFLDKQLENHNGLGKLFSRACTGSLGEKLDES